MKPNLINLKKNKIIIIIKNKLNYKININSQHEFNQLKILLINSHSNNTHNNNNKNNPSNNNKNNHNNSNNKDKKISKKIIKNIMLN